MKLRLLHETDEQLRKLERLAKTEGPEAEKRYLHARARHHPTTWYRRCTVCQNWRSHPLIVCPIANPQNPGPIGAIRVHGGHEEPNDSLYSLAKRVLIDPEETMIYSR